MSLGRIDWGKWYAPGARSISSLEHAYAPGRILDVLAEHLPRGSGSQVLELGCAPGRWLAWATTHLGVKPYGIDLEPVGVRLTQELYPEVCAARADAFHLPFRDATFDGVYALGLLEHFEDPTGILQEALRVLKPGGVGVWTVPNLAPGSICRWHWRRFMAEAFEAHRAYTLRELADLIRSSGLGLRHEEYNGLYIPHMQRVLGRLPLRRFLRRFEGSRTAASLVVVSERPMEQRADL